MLFLAMLGSHATRDRVPQQEDDPNIEESLSVSIMETSSPSSQNGYAVGDEISWTVVVSSAHSTIWNVSVQVTGMPSRIVTVPGRGAVPLTYTRTVAPEDVNSGSVSISASASATVASGEIGDSDSFSASTVEPYIDLSIAFQEINPLPAGTLYESGDAVSWRLSIANTGSLDISGASLEIYCNGTLLESNAAFDIDAGTADSISGTFTIRSSDAASGKISFSAVLQEPVVDNIEKPAWKSYMDILNVNSNVQLSWRFIVNTTLQSSGNKTTAVPIRLYGMQNASFNVDWGDGTSTTLIPSSYTNSSSSPSIHSYASTGTYTVTVTASSSNWASMYFMSCSSNNTSLSGWYEKAYPIFHFKTTVKEILDPIPPVAGVKLFSTTKPNASNEGTAASHSFAYLFYSSKLTTICDGLFSLNQNATSFQGTFYNSLLAGDIPLTTFYNCTHATSYDHCFYGSKVTGIASGVFNWAEGVTDFSYLFYGSPLRSMGAGLFANSPLVTSFWSAWKNCTSLTSLPQNLFAYTPLAMNFQSAFASCTKITSVAADTFASCTQATDFQQAFEKCTALTAVPQGFFTPCVEVTNFKSVFNGSSKIASIPNDLFQYNTKVTSFESALAGTSALGGFDLVIGSPNVATASSFCAKKSGVSRTVTVPAGSTTATTFNKIVSACGITVVQA